MRFWLQREVRAAALPCARHLRQAAQHAARLRAAPFDPSPPQLCMSETQARRALGCCPALAQLDVQLVQRRLRQLERGWDLTRGEAALLGLSRPHVLLPAPADVVSYALERPLIVRPR